MPLAGCFPLCSRDLVKAGVSEISSRSPMQCVSTIVSVGWRLIFTFFLVSNYFPMIDLLAFIVNLCGLYIEIVLMNHLTRLKGPCQRNECLRHVNEPFFLVFLEHHYRGNSFLLRLYVSDSCFIFPQCMESKVFEKIYKNVLPPDFFHVLLQWFNE